MGNYNEHFLDNQGIFNSYMLNDDTEFVLIFS
jgi:hypothetical protein